MDIFLRIDTEVFFHLDDKNKTIMVIMVKIIIIIKTLSCLFILPYQADFK